MRTTPSIIDKYYPQLKPDTAICHDAMTRLAKEASAYKPDLIIITFPHGISSDNDFSIYQHNEFASGNAEWLGEWSEYAVKVKIDQKATQLLKRTCASNGLKMAGITTHAAGPTIDAVLRWSEVVPIWFMERELKGAVPYVFIQNPEQNTWDDPASGQSKLRQFGDILYNMCKSGGPFGNRRVFLAVSGDQSHVLDHPHTDLKLGLGYRSHPYGSNPHGPAFDAAIKRWCETLDPRHFEESIPHMKEAKTCGAAGLTTLAQIIDRLKADGHGVHGKVLCDIHPLYYGMLCASFKWVEVAFSVFGKSYIGGEGMALWYQEERGQGGPALGNREWWHGLGIIFKTADVKSQVGDFPEDVDSRARALYLALNDGMKSFEDAVASTSKLHGNCTLYYRNHPGAVYFRVTYVNRTLQVEADLGRKFRPKHEPFYAPCITATDVTLPTGYYFGMTAQTSEHFMDDYDIFSFETYELNPRTSRKGTGRIVSVDAEEQKKIDDSTERVHAIMPDDDYAEGSPGEEPAVPEIAMNQIRETQLHILDALGSLTKRLEHLDAREADQEQTTPVPPALQPNVLSKEDLVPLSQEMAGIVNSVKTVGNRVDEIAAKWAEINTRLRMVAELKQDVDRLTESTKQQTQTLIGLVQEKQTASKASQSNLSW
ncbi:hypothetical protein HDU93_009584 [Gonapodya sp. JEL0774]|nr:hypothetical protein HDU93_009584 [Gonapodya sp. JEL0774]